MAGQAPSACQDYGPPNQDESSLGRGPLKIEKSMSKKLFVGGLAWATTDETLSESFGKYGEVTYARVITDRETGRSRGFGFVEFADDSSADEAIDAMNGAELDGRTIRVNEAQERAGGAAAAAAVVAVAAAAVAAAMAAAAVVAAAAAVATGGGGGGYGGGGGGRGGGGGGYGGGGGGRGGGGYGGGGGGRGGGGRGGGGGLASAAATPGESLALGAGLLGARWLRLPRPSPSWRPQRLGAGRAQRPLQACSASCTLGSARAPRRATLIR